MPRLSAAIALGLVFLGPVLTSRAQAQEVGPARSVVPIVDATAAAMDLAPDDPALALVARLPMQRPAETPDSHSPLAPLRSLRPRLRDTWAMPRLMWDDHPRGARWTSAVMGALRSHGAPLLDIVPRDIAAWCPGYAQADRGQRAAFWAGLVSTLAWHESTHDPEAVGGGGQWFGLVQIAPGTARWRNCQVQSGEALLDGPANLSCGIRIMAATVPRDGVVAEGMRGVAADWGPFHSSSKREDMRNWVRNQPYCLPRTRPLSRPDGLGTMAQAISLAAPALRPAQRPGPRPSPGPDPGSVRLAFAR